MVDFLTHIQDWLRAGAHMSTSDFEWYFLFFLFVFVASLIFARLIRHETSFYAAYGSNLLGAMVGGAAEYLSLVFGLQSLVLLSALFYGLAFFTLPGRRR